MGSSNASKFDVALGRLRYLTDELALALASDMNRAVHDIDVKIDTLNRKKTFRETDKAVEHAVLGSAEIAPSEIKYLDEQPFAEGGQGKVYRAQYQGETIAVKKVDLRG